MQVAYQQRPKVQQRLAVGNGVEVALAEQLKIQNENNSRSRVLAQAFVLIGKQRKKPCQQARGKNQHQRRKEALTRRP